MSSTTWRKKIESMLNELGCDWDALESITLNEAELDRAFDDGYGTVEGAPFTAWTRDYVLFPVVYDGSEWVGCVPRNPNGYATEHWGGY